MQQSHEIGNLNGRVSVGNNFVASIISGSYKTMEDSHESGKYEEGAQGRHKIVELFSSILNRIGNFLAMPSRIRLRFHGNDRNGSIWVQLAVPNGSTYEVGPVWNWYRGNGCNGSKSIRIGNEAIRCFQRETT